MFFFEPERSSSQQAILDSEAYERLFDAVGYKAEVNKLSLELQRMKEKNRLLEHEVAEAYAQVRSARDVYNAELDNYRTLLHSRNQAFDEI
jgi:hypothetical protein